MHARLSAALSLLLALPTLASAKPNVLLLLIDDLKPALGCYGDKAAITPNIDAFAATAMRFDILKSFVKGAAWEAPRTRPISRMGQCVNSGIRLFPQKEKGAIPKSEGMIVKHPPRPGSPIAA